MSGAAPPPRQQANAAAPAAPAMPAVSSQGKGLLWTSIIFTVLGTLAFLSTFITTAVLTGSSDAWAVIKGQITGVLIATLLGGLIFSIGLVLLLISRPSLTAWVPTLVSAIAITMSMTAVSVAAISR